LSLAACPLSVVFCFVSFISQSFYFIFLQILLHPSVVPSATAFKCFIGSIFDPDAFCFSDTEVQTESAAALTVTGSSG